MTVEYRPRIYAPLYRCPDSPGMRPFVLLDYDRMKQDASRAGYMPAKISEDIALTLASMSPYPDGVKTGVRKYLANGDGITLTQVAVLLGWAARRAQHTGR